MAASAASCSTTLLPSCSTRQSSHSQACSSRPQAALLPRRRLAGTPACGWAAAVGGAGAVRLRLRGGRSNGSRWTAAQWLENSAQIDCDVPLEEAFALWEDRERIPQWMPWITSVVVQQDDPRLSRWTLSTYQFNRQWEFSWLALNLTPLRNQKIHWRSVPGSTGGSLGSALEVQNRGQIRFVRKGPSKCSVKLTISYEVPGAMAPFASLLTPVVEGILSADMKRFAEYAVQYRQNIGA